MSLADDTPPIAGPTDPLDATAFDAVVIGAGPAGLMAAEQIAAAMDPGGNTVLVVEGKPSLGRKFLMAGKSGLNLTRDEPPEPFLAAFAEAAPRLAPILAEFGADAVRDWAEGLEQEVFTGTSQRVFPKAMKASPLLRAWLRRLSGQGVVTRTRWRWTGWQDAPGTGGDAAQTRRGLTFDTPEGPVTLTPRVVVLALGGASWPRLGSDGAWVPLLKQAGVGVAPLRPANAGLSAGWSPHMAKHFGRPVKGVALMAGATRSRGEFVVTKTGLEGGGIYTISGPVRDGADLQIDLCPDWPLDKVASRLARPRGKQSQTNHIRKALGLDAVKLALLQEFGRPLPDTRDAADLARLVKALPVAHAGLRPLDEAISTAGGVRWDGLDDDLMLTALPGVFAVGEMLDWEAPTGGYLLTACLATGRRAGRAAARRLQDAKAG